MAVDELSPPGHDHRCERQDVHRIPEECRLTGPNALAHDATRLRLDPGDQPVQGPAAVVWERHRDLVHVVNSILDIVEALRITPRIVLGDRDSLMAGQKKLADLWDELDTRFRGLREGHRINVGRAKALEKEQEAADARGDDLHHDTGRLRKRVQVLEEAMGVTTQGADKLARRVGKLEQQTKTLRDSTLSTVAPLERRLTKLESHVLKLSRVAEKAAQQVVDHGNELDDHKRELGNQAERLQKGLVLRRISTADPDPGVVIGECWVSRRAYDVAQRLLGEEQDALATANRELAGRTADIQILQAGLDTEKRRNRRHRVALEDLVDSLNDAEENRETWEDHFSEDVVEAYESAKTVIQEEPRPGPIRRRP